MMMVRRRRSRRRDRNTSFQNVLVLVVDMIVAIIIMIIIQTKDDYYGIMRVAATETGGGDNNDGASSSSSSYSSSGDLPNLVIMLADNLSYNDVSCFRDHSGGSRQRQQPPPPLQPPTTPHIDKMLASEGMKFMHWNSAAALCSASRAALLTSKYPVRTGVYPRVFKPDAVYGLDPTQTKTIATYLKDVGYSTKIVGKWHLGHRAQFLPTSHGFDEWVGIPYHMSGGSVDDHVCQYDSTQRMWLPLYKNQTIVEQPVRLETIKQIYEQESVEFIRRHAVPGMDESNGHGSSSVTKKPFFLFMSFSHVHQLCAPRDKPEQETCQWSSAGSAGASPSSSASSTFNDAVQEMDDIAGTILRSLDDYGLANNTFVLFTSDNGPWVAEQSCAGKKGMFEGEWLKHNVAQNCTACPHDYTPSPTKERPRRCILVDTTSSNDDNTKASGASDTDTDTDGVVWDVDGVHCGEDTGLGGVWESNLRMPSIAKFPGKILPGSISNDVVSTLDVLPTFLSMIGYQSTIPTDLDGIDVSNVLFNSREKSISRSTSGGRRRASTASFSHANGQNSTPRMLFFWRDGFEDGPLPSPYGRFDVAAVKYGHIKAWFWTKSAHYNDDVEQYHDPPLLFNIDEDPAEASPLDPRQYKSIIDEILLATKRHKQTIDWGPPLALDTDPKYIPCVDQKTGCRTTSASTPTTDTKFLERTDEIEIS